jgi:hypothetical protein
MRRGQSVLLLALCGCDPTSGLADTADAALPSVKRYFDGPGSRVADGPWNRVIVDLDADTLYHVGARRLDDSEPTFHLFGTDARDGCNVSPNAGTWLMGKPLAAPFRVLPYLERMDERGRGSLRFTTLDCEVQELVVEDAGRPYPRLYDKGYLVPTKQGYTFVDPWQSETYEIAEHLQSILLWKESILLWADGKLKSYTDQFEKGEELGSGITAVIAIKDSFLIEDDSGLHKVTFDRQSLELSSEDVLGDACHLQRSATTSSDEKGAWVILDLPCDSPRSSVVHLDEDLSVLERFELPFEADARYARALVSGPGADGPEPLATLYLTDVDDSGRGTLWAWRADAQEPIELGRNADLDSVFLETKGSDWDGVAQTNYQLLGGLLAHDWVHFRWNGETELIAERIVRNSSSGEVLVNFDGVAGDLPLFAADGLSIVAEDVPPYAGEATSYIGDRRYARVDHFDGDSGRLLLSADPAAPDSWQALGTGVTPEAPRFSWFMPALLFLENWDTERKVGTLVAYNYELDARSTIAEGVSSFDMTSYPWDGLIYAVPYGRSKGLWFTKAK